MKKVLKNMMVTTLAVTMILTQPFYAAAGNFPQPDAVEAETSAYSNASGIDITSTPATSAQASAIAGETATLPKTESENDLDPDPDLDLDPASLGDESLIAAPRVDSSGYATWDCIWFGSYWQGDTNGDGQCFSKDTTIIKKDDGSYYDQDDQTAKLYGFNGEEGFYPADEKQPIKWRVLGFDSNGYAILLSDRILEVKEFNTEEREVQWAASTLRAFLNGYYSSSNTEGIDYTGKGFIDKAFTQKERNQLADPNLYTSANPVYETGGSTWATFDEVTILSAQEATNSDYGFYKNEYTEKTLLDDSPENDMTDSDPNRVALDTSYVANLAGYKMSRDKMDEKGGRDELWWLRTPGYDTTRACTVNRYGRTRVYGSYVYQDMIGVRPVIHLLLSSSKYFWAYAGTVTAGSSGDTKDEIEAPEQVRLYSDETDETITMIPGELKRLYATVDKRYLYGVKWEITDIYPKGCLTIKNGVVTAKKAGTATITASYGISDPLTFKIKVDDTLPKLTVNKAEKITAKKSLTTQVGLKKAPTVTVSLPKTLRNRKVLYEIKNTDVCRITSSSPNKNGSKVTFTLDPKDAGATYIVWTVYIESAMPTQACTKVIVKRPITEVTITNKDYNSYKTLSLGEGYRLKVKCTENNTDPKDLVFKVTNKGIKVSKSGYVVGTLASAVNGKQPIVTVKSGKITDTFNFNLYTDDGLKNLAINKTFVNVTTPKENKTKKVTLKLSLPKKKAEQPEVTWNIRESHPGIIIEKDSKGNTVFSVEYFVEPGSYTITADAGETYNTACCEIMVK